MSICIFPGTFNPIHNAHIKMAEFAVEKYGFDKIIFIPSYIPPHKSVDSSLANHRYNMVKLAISGHKNFEISDIEYKSKGKSYSLITVQKIKQQYSIKDKLNFIIGTDAFLKINSWYNADELKKEVHFIVFNRQGSCDSKLLSDLKSDGWSFELAKNDFIDVSSTEIRNCNKINDVSSKVKEYIDNYGLYS